MSMRSLVKRMLPVSLLAAYRDAHSALQRRRNASRSRAEVFAETYEKHVWGGGNEPFSGGGSRGPVVDAYVEAVLGFIEQRGLRSIVDLGCGDFHVGQRLVRP